MSDFSQRLLWAAVGGVFGPLAGLQLGRGGFLEALLAGLACATLAGVLGPWLSSVLPVFGVVVGPVLTLALMNLQRFTLEHNPSSGAGRGAQAALPQNALAYAAAGIGLLAGTLLAVLLLQALRRRLRGERPLRASYRSLAWTCFWITLGMVLISNFAPL